MLTAPLPDLLPPLPDAPPPVPLLLAAAEPVAVLPEAVRVATLSTKVTADCAPFETVKTVETEYVDVVGDGGWTDPGVIDDTLTQDEEAGIGCGAGVGPSP